MAYHCYHQTPCPACGRHYVRFDATEACPWCGSAEAPVYDLVEEVVHYARQTLIAQGHLAIGGFVPTTLADGYVVRAYEALEARRRLPELPAALVAAEAVQSWRLADEAEQAHWERFLVAVLEHWEAERHRAPAE
ncbi:MAG: hypothetical protein HYU66_26750 [Armatimonadetes bacterium]|nr:hypothetical protein [Armatimonadota bacterium]